MRIIRASILALPVALVLGLAAPAAAQEEEAKAEAKTEMKTKVTLEARNESGITGTAVITRAEEAEKPHAHAVRLELSGADAGTYPAHIHRGTCESGGGVAAPLTSITVEEGAMTASSTTVITPEQLAAGDRPVGEAEAKAEAETEEGMVEAGMRHEAGERMEHGPLYIQVHLADGTPAACGDLPHGGSHEKHEKKDEGGY